MFYLYNTSLRDRDTEGCLQCVALLLLKFSERDPLCNPLYSGNQSVVYDSLEVKANLLSQPPAS